MQIQDTNKFPKRYNNIRYKWIKIFVHKNKQNSIRKYSNRIPFCVRWKKL